jgi:hypothetical protein
MSTAVTHIPSNLPHQYVRQCGPTITTLHRTLVVPNKRSRLMGPKNIIGFVQNRQSHNNSIIVSISSSKT